MPAFFSPSTWSRPVAGLGLLWPVLALADAPNPSFYLINRSDQRISEVYASPASAPAWGNDRLGDATIDPNRFAAIRLRADGTCVFDLRIVYENGQADERRGVNTCALDNFSVGSPAGRPAPGSNAAAGNDPSFRLVNRGGEEIDEVYLRITGTAPWGRDRLGNDVVDAGDSFIVDMPLGRCTWDLKLVLESGRVLLRRGLNLCQLTDLPVP